MEKIIHYCWFGRNKLPELAEKCIQSWQKYCPDYEIREWNEDNFDLESCEYVKEAYQAGKWAFVSDYARFKILYEHGGIYFDTDVELIKPIDDIVESGPFMGFETNASGEYAVAPGLGLGVYSGNSLYKEILEDYEKSHFIENGEINYITVVDRITGILRKYGLQNRNIFQKVKDINIYPSEYFCPLSYATEELNITESTRSIHWYDASWLDARMQKRRKRCVMIRKRFPGNRGEFLCKYYMKLSYVWEWIVTGKVHILITKVRKKILKK